MDSRRRAELLATLSPEGLATYEVLKAQLARDLDRNFAASKARREKSVETAFADLHTKLDRTIDDLRWKVRGDDGRRSAPTAVALASSTMRSAAFPPVPRGSGATVADISTPATISAPSAHTATSTCAPMLAALDSTSPRVLAVTATPPMAPAASIDLNLKRDIDHLVGGSTTPTSNPSAVITAATATHLRSTSSTANWVAASVGAATASIPPTMCSTECPGEENSETRTTPTSTIAPPASSTSAIPATCEVSIEVNSMALMNITSSSPILTKVTTTQALSPTKCSTEGLNGESSVACLKYLVSSHHQL
ncbi:uncharacterized protein [Aegilops tauschii subsp. strangulata]|uniref:uncharacterized protein isoform X2 n=1 Tax=Aegilops tauschii subsp. strangulata TaxID=200361 RepID=UPI003CC8B626